MLGARLRLERLGKRREHLRIFGLGRLAFGFHASRLETAWASTHIAVVVSEAQNPGSAAALRQKLPSCTASSGLRWSAVL